MVAIACRSKFLMVTTLNVIEQSQPLFMTSSGTFLAQLTFR